MLRKKIFKCKAYAKINLFLNVLNKTKNNLDSSTNGLINFYKKLSHK